MSEQELAALEGAADDVVDTSEATENTDGQEQDQPAKADEAAEKTKSQLRRERREAADRQRQEELTRTKRDLAAAEAQLARVRAANEKVGAAAASDDPLVEAGAVAARTVGQIREAELQGQVDAHNEAIQLAHQMRVQERARDFAEGITEAREKHTDFDAALAVAQDPNVVSQGLSVMILESDAPHEIAYHLGKNPALARTLSSMSPVQAAREIGRLEASLSAPKPTTAAPSPISPVKPGGAPRKDPRAMTPQEFAKWRDEGGTF